MITFGIGYLYFCIFQLEPEFHPQRVKIAVVSNPEKKLHDIRKDSPYASLVKVYPCEPDWDDAVVSITSDCEPLTKDIFLCDIYALLHIADNYFDNKFFVNIHDYPFIDDDAYAIRTAYLAFIKQSTAEIAQM